ncbi:UNVERIFIED_CONTAM: hypothetical protein HDU68_011737 [Siphonaria sp. JEL0065]|nr:hypothetical protein HDU68_011737 [Siphonaria sp. JEL0065]
MLIHIRQEEATNPIWQGAITTASFYTGNAPIAHLQSRLDVIVEANPWLAGTLIQHKPWFSSQTFIEQSTGISRLKLGVFQVDGIGVTLDASQLSAAIESKAPAILVSNADQCIKAREPIFKVSVIQSINASEFVLVVSISHLIADGATFYKIHDMFDKDSPIQELNPIRLNDSQIGDVALFKVLPDQAIFKKSWFALALSSLFLRWIVKDSVSFIATAFLRVLGKRIASSSAGIASRDIDPAYIQLEKTKYHENKESGINWISSNDIVTSWFFKTINCNIGLMSINLRGRMNHVVDDLAGNYESTIMYTPADYQSPSQLRASVIPCNDAFVRINRASTSIHLPFFSSSSTIGLVTNWASLHKRDISFPPEVESVEFLRHVPVISFDVKIPGFFQPSILYAPCAGKLSLLSSSKIVNEMKGFDEDPTSPFL